MQAVKERYETSLTRNGRPAKGIAATGDRMPDGSVLVLPGDLSGDGKINLADLTRCAGALHKPGALEEAAGDIDGDGTFNICDLTELAAYIRTPWKDRLSELPPFEIGYFEDQAREMADEINRYRVSLGLSPLEYREDMSLFCQERAEEMARAQVYTHKRPDGRDFWDGAVVPPSSEVIQHCWVIPEENKYMDAAYWAVDSWKGSPSHDKAIRNETAAYIGCGIAFGKNEENGRWQWVAAAHMGHARD